MTKFIGLNLARLDEDDQMYRTGSVLLNVENIVSVETYGAPFENSLGKITVINSARPFIVEGNMIDLLDVIKRAGADFHAYDNSKRASKAAEQRVKGAK